MPGTEHRKFYFEFGNYLNFRNVGAKCKQNDSHFTSQTSFGRDRMPGREHRKVDKLGNYLNYSSLEKYF